MPKPCIVTVLPETAVIFPLRILALLAGLVAAPPPNPPPVPVLVLAPVPVLAGAFAGVRVCVIWPSIVHAR